jgi:PAS domain S-box-containing protein
MGDQGCPEEVRRQYVILGSAVENTNEAFVTIDQESRVLFFNKAAEQMFGYDRAEVLGRDLGEILAPSCRSGHQDAVARYVRTGESRLLGHESELQIARKDGTVLPAAISFSVTKVDDRLYFTGIIRDLSHTKMLQDRILQQERLVFLGQTVAEISHEIKNPLVMIGGFARQLLKKAKATGEREKLSVIVAEVVRLENLLTEMRDLYKVPQLHLEPVSLNGLLEEVVSLARGHSGSDGVKVLLEAGPEVVVPLDREKMKQVLLNLVKNGIEASGQDDRVVVSTRLRERHVEIIVTDTGQGISEAVRKRIFFPFFTTKEQGTGLGLCIAKRIVEDHPDSIFQLHSEEGKGTVATVSLARVSSPSPRDHEAAE